MPFCHPINSVTALKEKPDSDQNGQMHDKTRQRNKGPAGKFWDEWSSRYHQRENFTCVRVWPNSRNTRAIPLSLLTAIF